MRHRERVATALAREEPDRCPMQISFTPEFADRLRADMGVRGELNVARGGEHNPHGGGNTYELERAIDSDLILTSVGWANNYYAGSRHLHRRVGRDLEGAPLRDAVRHGPLHRDGGLPAGRGRRHRLVRAARPEPAGAVRRLRARHPRVRRRVLDRRRHRHHHLRDGLGAARLRAAAHGPAHRTPSWPTASWRSPSATTSPRPRGWPRWAWT